MAFIVIGLALLAMKLLETGFAADWPWWGILLPFGLALAWWFWADASGLTRKREMEKDEARKEERRRRNIEALGMEARSSKRKRP